MPRVILVEDNRRLADIITLGLSRVGMEVDHFEDSEQAWSAMRDHDYAALILDRGLPDGDGLNLLRRLRSRQTATPCLILTALGAVHDRVTGLDAGADDYLTKPFAMEELVARTRALTRRPPMVRTRVHCFGDIEACPETQALRRHQQEVPLAAAETQILICLIEADGAMVRRHRLEHAAWGLSEAVTPNALDVAIHRLRGKLRTIGARTRVTNSRGQGFRLEYTEAADD